MRVHAIIHAPFEMPGVIEEWAIQNNHEFSLTHTYKGEQLPNVSKVDFLVIMGGPQSPAELDKYPYLRDEIAFTKTAIEQEKVVLGVCLGAQIIGESLGANVEHSPNKEIGIFTINLTKEAASDPIFKNFSKEFDVIHWHNDMPGITENAVVLAYSEGCPRQIIKYSERVYGLQCHMEMTPQMIRGMVEHCPDDLSPGEYIQSKEQLQASKTSDINNKMFLILDCLASLISKTINENAI